MLTIANYPRTAALLLAAAVVAAFLPTAGAAPDGSQPKVIYGSDNRDEVFGLRGAPAVAAAATAALVETTRISDNGNSTSRLLTVSLERSRNLCPGHRFASQPTATFCSGVLVAPAVVATAGHCINSGDVSDTAPTLDGMRFVFGFQATSATTFRTTIANADIYRGVRLLAQREDQFGDFALVQLDRSVTGRVPVLLSRGGPPAVGTPVYVVGHPSGLPAKIAGGASVVRVTPAFFQANLDTFEGNSGSPVFRIGTTPLDLVVPTLLGVVSRGRLDYSLQGSCNIINAFPNSAATELGESVSNAGGFAAFVPQR